ncbi:MAG: glutamate 5-kinase [Pseudomonadales bacterium]|jgi:glutamate 5-kinase|nr:glutamate 5-kinase [Pseudomonadales bacterium]
MSRELLTQAKTWVIKIGSSLLTDNGKGLNRDSIARWGKQICALQDAGLDVVLVSSGAVAEGVRRLGLPGRPSAIHEQQAAAAVGQMGLIEAYESQFQQFGKRTAQILLTHDDLSNRKRYLNARSTLRTLLDLRVIPVINENDTVVTDEICFGDNDTLGALVANLINADVLVILTDQAGVFDADPRHNADARLISEAKSSDDMLLAVAGGSGALGKGGMLTKIRAARLASRSGTATCIVHGSSPDVLLALQRGEALGTLLVADKQPVTARKQWLANHLQVRGRLTLDQGAVRVLQAQGKSLLPVGITLVSGAFKRGDLVACVDESGRTIAHGLVNYDADEAQCIAGRSSEQIPVLLGYDGDHEMIHRDNLALV